MRGTSRLGSVRRACLGAAALLGVFASGFGLVGCAGPVDYARPYPTDKAQGETLNVQVFRRENHIRLTNTSPYDFGPSTLWVNASFSRPIEGLRIGQTIDLSLSDFRNEFAQAFRAGGFFSTELPSKLVLAQIESDDQMYGLIVVQDRAN